MEINRNGDRLIIGKAKDGLRTVIFYLDTPLGTLCSHHKVSVELAAQGENFLFNAVREEAVSLYKKYGAVSDQKNTC